ncbi:MAG: hypothetical protein QG670_2867 [Thermoproteota archaeon]|nr:hypothetical protein [Thermoproteota archaeon]
MSGFKDITNQRYGILTVEKPAFSDKNHKWHWLCKCDCGNTCIVDGRYLRKGKKLSCGCVRVVNENGRIITRKGRTGQSRKGIPNPKNLIHGFGKTRLATTRNNMMQRCYNPKHKSYPQYGGRGITVCDEWINNLPSFYEWAVASGYKDNLTIDRIDNNGNYCPENCKWSTSIEQGNNQRTNRHITYQGKTLTPTQWGRELKIAVHLIRNRIFKLGWTVEKTFLTPAREKKIIDERKVLKFNNCIKSIKQWSDELNIPLATIKTRVRKGLSDEECLNSSYKKRK